MYELFAVGELLEQNQLPAVPNNNFTFRSTCRKKADDRPDDTKHLTRKQCVHFASVGIGSDDFKNLASRNNNFLLLLAAAGYLQTWNQKN